MEQPAMEKIDGINHRHDFTDLNSWRLTCWTGRNGKNLAAYGGCCAAAVSASVAKPAHRDPFW